LLGTKKSEERPIRSAMAYWGTKVWETKCVHPSLGKEDKKKLKKHRSRKKKETMGLWNPPTGRLKSLFQGKTKGRGG